MRILFVDKDGNHTSFTEHMADWDDFRVVSDVIDGLRELKERVYQYDAVVVVGYLTYQDKDLKRLAKYVNKNHSWMITVLAPIDLSQLTDDAFPGNLIDFLVNWRRAGFVGISSEPHKIIKVLREGPSAHEFGRWAPDDA